MTPCTDHWLWLMTLIATFNCSFISSGMALINRDILNLVSDTLISFLLLRKNLQFCNILLTLMELCFHLMHVHFLLQKWWNLSSLPLSHIFLALHYSIYEANFGVMCLCWHDISKPKCLLSIHTMDRGWACSYYSWWWTHLHPPVASLCKISINCVVFLHIFTCHITL